MKKYFSRFIFFISVFSVPYNCLSQDISDTNRIRVEITLGMNRIFFRDPVQEMFPGYISEVKISGLNTFLAGVMINRNITKNISLDFGFSYTNFKMNRSIKDSSQLLTAIFKSNEAILKADLVARYVFNPASTIKVYGCGGSSFNIFLKNDQAIMTRYEFYPFDRDRDIYLNRVGINPKLGFGGIYKKHRIELCYGFAIDIASEANRKLRIGYVGLGYYFSIFEE
jgi:hypothetical protein